MSWLIKKMLRLPVHVPAMANADNMNCIFERINLIDYAVVAITQTITTRFVPLEGFALKGM